MREIDDVTEQPAHDELTALIPLEPAAPPPGVPVATTAEPEKRKGGWPKGKPRGPRRPAAQRPYNPNDAMAASTSAPEPPAAAAPRGMPDPSMVEFVRGPVRMVVLMLTRLAGRWMNRPDMEATPEEADAIADAGAVVLAMRFPTAAGSSPEMALVLACAVYAIPRFDGPQPPAQGALSGEPVAVVERPE